MGTAGVGSPSRKKPMATVASSVGLSTGRLVGEAVGEGEGVWEAVGDGSGSWVALGSALVGRGVLVGAGVSLGGSSVGVADGRFTTAKEAVVGVGGGAAELQALKTVNRSKIKTNNNSRFV